MWEALGTLLGALLAVLLPALLRRLAQERGRAVEDSAPQEALRQALEGRIRRTWGHTWSKARVILIVLGLVGLLVSGCATRTIYVPPGQPVRLRQTVRDVKVWVLDAQGRPVPAVMDLPEGWYCLPPPPQAGGGPQ